MGYDVSRFEGSVDEELICPICSAVLEDPRLAPEYEKYFIPKNISNRKKYLSQQKIFESSELNLFYLDVNMHFVRIA